MLINSASESWESYEGFFSHILDSRAGDFSKDLDNICTVVQSVRVVYQAGSYVYGRVGGSWIHPATRMSGMRRGIVRNFTKKEKCVTERQILKQNLYLMTFANIHLDRTNKHSIVKLLILVLKSFRSPSSLLAEAPEFSYKHLLWVSQENLWCYVFIYSK